MSPDSRMPSAKASAREAALCVFIEVKNSFASFLIRAFQCVVTVLCPRLTSASRCGPSPARLRVRGGVQTSPGNAHDFHIYARPIYLTRFRTGFGLCVFCARLSTCPASYRLPVRQANALLRLPSDSTSRWTPLPVAMAFPLSGRLGTFTR